MPTRESTDRAKTKVQQMETMLQGFEAQKNAYFESVQKVHDLLSSNLGSNQGPSSGFHAPKIKLLVQRSVIGPQTRGLREELYVGTSVKESRKSVEASETTVQQGHNIKLLTLVSIFLLPCQFVTSVFGMTNMPQNPNYRIFGIVLAAVCIPSFILIGSLNTNRDMVFWRNRFCNSFIRIVKLLSFLGRCFEGKKEPACGGGEEGEQKERLSLQHVHTEPQPNSRRSMFSHAHRSQDSGLSAEGGHVEYSARVCQTPTSKLAEILKGKHRRASTRSTEE